MFEIKFIFSYKLSSLTLCLTVFHSNFFSLDFNNLCLSCPTSPSLTPPSIFSPSTLSTQVVSVFLPFLQLLPFSVLAFITLISHFLFSSPSVLSIIVSLTFSRHCQLVSRSQFGQSVCGTFMFILQEKQIS